MTEQLATSNEKWSAIKKISFLFVFVYSFLYMLPLPIGWLVIWIGENILHISHVERTQMTGSGDTTYDYVQEFSILLIAIVPALVIFIIDRKRKSYANLLYWLFAAVRYYLAYFMISYGCYKVFKSQFVFPSLYQLEQSYGDSSPMRLLWIFMGYSTPYTFFSGAAEILGGVLLLFRRTTLLGSLIVIAVVSNVLMMNLSYDVPVKLFSAHLLLFGILILLPNLKAVIRFFILNKPGSSSDYFYPALPKRERIILISIKYLILTVVIIHIANSAYEIMNKSNTSNVPLRGIYRTETFVRNGDTIPPLATDSTRWSKLIMDNRSSTIFSMTNNHETYTATTDTVKKEIDFRQIEKRNNHLSYNETKDFLFLRGKWENDSLNIKLHKVDINNYLLVNRGFHWINEYPFNK